MMMSNSDHAWTREQMATVLVEGLSAEEQSRFDAHLAACATCAAEFAEMKQREADLVALFADAKPSPGFEDRLIRSLRETKPPRTWIHPMVRRAATGVAAALLLASAGYVVSAASNGGKLPDLYAIGNRVKAASSLRGIAAPIALASNENRDAYGIAGEPHLSATPASNAEKDDFPGKDSIDKKRFAEFSKNLSHSYAHPPQAKQLESAAREAPLASYFVTGQDEQKRPAVEVSVSNPTADWSSMAVDTFKPAQIAARAPQVPSLQVQAGKPTGETLAVAGAVVEGVKVGDNVNFSLQTAQPAPGQQPASDGGGNGGQSLFSGVQVAQTAPGGQAPPPPDAQSAPAIPNRKVIRTGVMEFEVDRFDAALAMITKLTQEAGGYIGTTDSEKLPNGKVKGSVVVRVPPDRLDTLVLQLRGIGDLRSQKMDAQDVTKQYTDLEGELRAARAMKERLLEIIKTGKGEIKDLLAAEKELGVWRTKIEKMVGEMRYYDNLVALTTLTITAFERDIRNAATAKETETIDAGIETDDVETARAAALKAIDDAKGRVIQSDLKRHDAGQFSAQVVADVSPDAAGALVDRLKQMGKVARFEVQRKQTTPDGTTQPAVGARLERSETRINLSLYNLANVAPRQTTNLNLAAADVEAAYKAIAARVEKAGGRIVTSTLSRPQAEQVVGAIHFEVKSNDAEAVLSDVRALGDVVRLIVTENADTSNVTTAKQGFMVQIADANHLPPRQTTALAIETADPDEALADLQSFATSAGGRVVESTLSQERGGQTIGKLVVEVPLAKSLELITHAKSQGSVRMVQSTKDAQGVDVSLARARVDMTFATSAGLVAPDQGLWSTIRRGLATSMTGLMWSLQLIIIGLCFVGPWVIVIALIWKVIKRRRNAPGSVPA